ncbi:hypothetical protein LOD99_3673 [Oopsacas minuta]|uniref:HAT C-terminal dimerisation domain-containing protein n=1 Tax=Oopsacas minuta TaxID=111878 RepID=A0AAV7JY87_9METZ|nr:hypothetical protein LOD99_3673 [Oopsacas minuta]
MDPQMRYVCLQSFSQIKTSENIGFELDQILTEVYCDPANTPVTTDKGANMVAATAQKIRIDCACHRINTAIKTGWERAMMENEELDQLHDDVNKAVTFAKKSSGIQSELPISLKRGASIQNVAPSYYALQNAWEIETEDDPLTRILKRIMTEELVQKENQVDEPLLPSAPKSNRLDPLLCFRNCSTTVSTNNYTNWNEENLRSELTGYEKIISIQYDEDIFDPIKWWGKHSCRFPITCFLSQSFLVIQASSAESERHFSSADRVTRKDREKLNPDTVEGLVLLNDALKKKII